MSGAMVRAAAAGRPLLASNYGLMGEMIRRHSLGLTVDSSMPDEIARGIMKFAEYDPLQMFDHAKARRFADENSSERYPHIVFKQIFSSLKQGQ
jgi:glycosyltransferase involved in cell wall biosynthesis